VVWKSRGRRCRQQSFAQARANVSAQHAFVVLAGLLSHPGFHSCLKPAIKIFVECDLCAFQIAAQVAFAQPPGQVCLRFPHGTVDGSIVVFAFVSFLIAAQINPDEPSAVASCDDLANFASHRDFLLGSQERHTPRTLPLASSIRRQTFSCLSPASQRVRTLVPSALPKYRCFRAGRSGSRSSPL
jgi:hypothetical protein